MPRLEIIITSTREGRAGLPVANWFAEQARAHGGFDVGVTDLKELALPLLDEPNHPTRRQYQHEHTKRWSAIVEAADAFVFVVPEYNHSMPPALLNALNYLYVEWNYKPASFCSYGGISGGLRSVEFSLSMLAALKLVAIPELVSFTYFSKLIQDGVLVPADAAVGAATKVLDELRRWSDALKVLRT